jgi:hypothetical protein
MNFTMKTAPLVWDNMLRRVQIHRHNQEPVIIIELSLKNKQERTYSYLSTIEESKTNNELRLWDGIIITFCSEIGEALLTTPSLCGNEPSLSTIAYTLLDIKPCKLVDIKTYSLHTFLREVAAINNTKGRAHMFCY